MKKTGPHIGHTEVTYYLGPLFARVVTEFVKADAESIQTDAEYDVTKASELVPHIFDAKRARTEAGVLALFAGGALLERVLYEYAVSYIDPNYYEEHFGRLQVLPRWILLPRLCQGKIIDDKCQEINDLREFIKARNAVVHPKVQIFGRLIDDFETANRRTTKESARFNSVCRKLKLTVDALIKILTDPASDEKWSADSTLVHAEENF